jgi:hypothetical protein
MNHLKILFISFFLSSLVLSQNDKSPEERAVMQTERFAKELQLSADQKAQFLTIQTGINQKIDGIRISKMNEDEKRNALNSIREGRTSMLQAILNDEQKQKMTALDEKQKMNAQKKKKNRKKKRKEKIKKSKSNYI